MNQYTKILTAVVAILTALLQVPVIQQALVQVIAQHPTVSIVVGAISTVSALLHNPTPKAQ